MIVSSLSELIGNTPILRIPFQGNKVELFIKLEIFNPCGSMKDRMALSMLNRVEQQAGDPDQLHIVESSSGNTATALSMLCTERNYKFTAIMDGHAAADKVSAVRALGGEVRLIGAAEGRLATAERDEIAHRLAAEDDNTYCTAQHDNPANADGYTALAGELLNQIGPNITHFFAAIGTGGSLCGTSRALKQANPAITVIGVEPEGSIIFGGPAQDYLQSGTGTPDGASVGLVIDYEVIDQGKKVSDLMAFATCRALANCYGLMVGGSAGGAIFEAIRYCATAPEGTRVVTLACDNGTKYLDSIYDDEWLRTRLPDIDQAINEVTEMLTGGPDYRAQVQKNRSRLQATE
ncbi:PLP-dependent cysteine synthase family protein [Aestuariispira ectoiniformans]|uniref:PLP-dependent cysteine synthase family protein n=1 Tax=Aestuariispira ectoiniformans TaxID=2775080 RepID=UPI00223BD903|nr:cysteine synthase family protein [Aestuariispira ectoiniformans]